MNSQNFPKTLLHTLLAAAEMALETSDEIGPRTCRLGDDRAETVIAIELAKIMLNQNSSTESYPIMVMSGSPFYELMIDISFISKVSSFHYHFLNMIEHCLLKKLNPLKDIEASMRAADDNYGCTRYASDLVFEDTYDQNRDALPLLSAACIANRLQNPAVPVTINGLALYNAISTIKTQLTYESMATDEDWADSVKKQLEGQGRYGYRKPHEFQERVNSCIEAGKEVVAIKKRLLEAALSHEGICKRMADISKHEREQTKSILAACESNKHNINTYQGKPSRKSETISLQDGLIWKHLLSDRDEGFLVQFLPAGHDLW